jgi:deoxyribodipyrimidine photo-lyase
VAGDGKGLLAALAARAAVVVTDDAVGFFQPAMIAAAARAIDARLEVVDGNGLMPMRLSTRAFPTARGFRTFWQKSGAHTALRPSSAPPDHAALRGGAPPDHVVAQWQFGADVDVAQLPIDHGVPRAGHGGTTAARAALASFLTTRLPRYQERAHPDADAQSGLSPWLHFGHLGAHEVADAAMAADAGGAEGARDAFLDELITWRELALQNAALDPHALTFEGVPAWARRTLAAHAGDGRAVLDAAALQEARSGDPLWDAAQRQLLQTGVMHNYLRMLWGKRTIFWSATPLQAWQRLVEMNNRWALDGRDASSYAGIGWCFGKFDRPWPPDKPVLGLVRTMTTASAQKKLELSRFLRRFGGGQQPLFA